MILVGDIAIHPSDSFRLEGFPRGFFNSPFVSNLEGAILSKGRAIQEGVFNKHCWCKDFQSIKQHVAFLGNNHIDDVKCGIQKTCNHLDEDGILRFGLVDRKSLLPSPITIKDGDTSVSLYGLGWGLIGCPKPGRTRAGVPLLERKKNRDFILRSLQSSAIENSIVVIHGNYEFEEFLQPAHRRFAHDCIDAGATGVVFHHPHIVGPIEPYKNGFVAHTIGNWAFSQNRFFRGGLAFPEISNQQIALEVCFNKETGLLDILAHHCYLYSPSIIRYEGSENVRLTSSRLYPEFAGMSDDQYERWFRMNRKKSYFLPIFSTKDSFLEKTAKELFVKVRQRFIQVLLKFGVKRRAM